jgi:Sec-independent protein translocase protein TatA
MDLNVETIISIVVAVVLIVFFFGGNKIRETIQAFKKN